jgi:hypothetical protein
MMAHKHRNMWQIRIKYVYITDIVHLVGIQQVCDIMSQIV